MEFSKVLERMDYLIEKKKDQVGALLPLTQPTMNKDGRSYDFHITEKRKLQKAKKQLLDMEKARDWAIRIAENLEKLGTSHDTETHSQ